MITQNKGEWSELYVFLKLLGEGVIYAADADLNKIEDLHYPIIKILRTENKSEKEYCYDSPLVRIIDAESQNCLLELPVDEFKQKAEILLEAIKKSEGTFAVDEIEKFMQVIYCTKVKADSADKSDIQIILHDIKVNRDTQFGFSIKSKLGNPSTLLNAGETTNFIYEIEGNLTEVEIAEINTISSRSKIKDRVNKIIEKGCTLKFSSMSSENFCSNLQVIDSALPEIASELLLLFYQGVGYKIDILSEKVMEINPCNYNLTNNSSFYEYKIKNLLSDTALGMTPSSPWSGRIDATGGYIVVKEDGEILCYHLYNRNEFQDYLFKNTRLETASSSRYNFGKIYSENGKNYIKLNLQVRFV